MIRKEILKELSTYIGEFQIVEKRKVEQPTRHFITVDQYRILLQDGNNLYRDKVVKQGSSGNAVVILPITKENNVLLVIQPRVFTENGVGVELPAGYVELGESIEEASKRELLEETGYLAKNYIPLGSYYQDQGCMSAKNHSVLALDAEKVSVQQLDDSEYIRYLECTYEEALELIDMGYINDANSIITLEKSKKLIRRRENEI